MKTSTTQAPNLRPTIGKIAMALAVASVMGAMAITPALAKDNKDRKEHQDQGLHRGQNKVDRDRTVYQPVYRPVYQDPYRYSQPVYAPPPVYYEPQPSAGISLFFPLDIRF
jgi:cell division protein FtsN